MLARNSRSAIEKETGSWPDNALSPHNHNRKHSEFLIVISQNSECFHSSVIVKRAPRTFLKRQTIAGSLRPNGKVEPSLR